MRTRTLQSVAVVGIGVMGAATVFRRAERRTAVSFSDSVTLASLNFQHWRAPATNVTVTAQPSREPSPVEHFLDVR